MALAAIGCVQTREMPPMQPEIEMTAWQARTADAREVVVDKPDGLVKAIDRPYQKSLYRVQAEAHVFYELKTNRGLYTPNTVLRLFDESGTQLAENDEGYVWAGDGIDARIVTRFTRGGTYYVEVEDTQTPPEYFDKARAGMFYRLTVRRLDSTTTGYTIEDPLTGANKIEFTRRPDDAHHMATIVGEFETGYETDSFSFEGLPASALIGRIHRVGAAGTGSTSTRSLIWVVDDNGDTVASVRPHVTDQHKISPPLNWVEYTMLLASEQDDTGGNGFYVIDLAIVPDNPKEKNDLANDSFQWAETLDVHWRTRTSYGYVTTNLPGQDVDYFRFKGHVDEQVSIECKAGSEGSGLVGLTAQLRSANDRVVAQAVENDFELMLPQTNLQQDGHYYLRLTSPEHRWGVLGDWARCVVTIRHF